LFFLSLKLFSHKNWRKLGTTGFSATTAGGGYDGGEGFFLNSCCGAPEMLWIIFDGLAGVEETEEVILVLGEVK
jgi:hypothetical protein